MAKVDPKDVVIFIRTKNGEEGLCLVKDPEIAEPQASFQLMNARQLGSEEVAEWCNAWNAEEEPSGGVESLEGPTLLAKLARERKAQGKEITWPIFGGATGEATKPEKPLSVVEQRQKLAASRNPWEDGLVKPVPRDEGAFAADHSLVRYAVPQWIRDEFARLTARIDALELKHDTDHPELRKALASLIASEDKSTEVLRAIRLEMQVNEVKTRDLEKVLNEIAIRVRRRS
jgi:hypothetical protein